MPILFIFFNSKLKKFSSNIIKFHIFQPNLKKKKKRAKLEKETYKKNQFKAQLIQNRPKRTEIDRVDQNGLNGTDVDLIGLNRNCLIFRENELSSTNFREKIICYITITK